MATKRCPKCSLINPGSAQRCDCGYSFTDGTIGRSLVPKPTEDQVEARRQVRILGPTIAGLGLGAIFLAARLVVHDDYPWADPAILVLSAFGLLLAVGGIAMRFAKR